MGQEVGQNRIPLAVFVHWNNGLKYISCIQCILGQQVGQDRIPIAVSVHWNNGL